MWMVKLLVALMIFVFYFNRVADIIRYNMPNQGQPNQSMPQSAAYPGAYSPTYESSVQMTASPLSSGPPSNPQTQFNQGNTSIQYTPSIQL